MIFKMNVTVMFLRIPSKGEDAVKSGLSGVVLLVLTLTLGGCGSKGKSADIESRRLPANPITDIALLPNKGARLLTDGLQSIRLKQPGS